MKNQRARKIIITIIATVAFFCVGFYTDSIINHGPAHGYQSEECGANGYTAFALALDPAPIFSCAATAQPKGWPFVTEVDYNNFSTPDGTTPPISHYSVPVDSWFGLRGYGSANLLLYGALSIVLYFVVLILLSFTQGLAGRRWPKARFVRWDLSAHYSSRYFLTFTLVYLLLAILTAPALSS